MMTDELEQMSPNQRRALDKALSALETFASIWAAEIRLSELSARIAAVPTEAERAKRIAAMIEQGFIEGAYRHYLDHKDKCDELASREMDPNEKIYVWFAENDGAERNGEQFIRAWTHDPARVDGLRNAIGKEPTIYSAILQATTRDAITPYAYVYEWDYSPGVVHRSFSSAPYNGRRPDRTIQVFKAPKGDGND